jgi:hypothetical protein
MPELGTYGSVRGVPGNGHSYRDHRQLGPGARATDLSHPRQVLAEHLGVQEQQGRQRLPVRGRCDFALVGEPTQESLDFGPSEISWMPKVVKADKCPTPLHIGLLRTPAVVQQPNAFANLVEKPDRPQRCERRASIDGPPSAPDGEQMTGLPCQLSDKQTPSCPACHEASPGSIGQKER